MKYHFVITTALVARYCIEGGMELSTAYGLSDFYIQKADQCRTPKEVSDLHPVMCEDYTKRMKNLRKQKICSKHIADCIDYIYEHLHTRITIHDLSEYVGLNPSYLSRLFKRKPVLPSVHIFKTKKLKRRRICLYIRIIRFHKFLLSWLFQARAILQRFFIKELV